MLKSNVCHSCWPKTSPMSVDVELSSKECSIFVRLAFGLCRVFTFDTAADIICNRRGIKYVTCTCAHNT
jgi:hypothetical protein